MESKEFSERLKDSPDFRRRIASWASGAIMDELYRMADGVVGDEIVHEAFNLRRDDDFGAEGYVDVDGRILLVIAIKDREYTFEME